jgi:hypothetical protein
MDVNERALTGSYLPYHGHTEEGVGVDDFGWSENAERKSVMVLY